MNQKGHVLAQVLITAVIVSVMAAGLMQLVMLRYTVMARGAEGAAKKQQAMAAFNTLLVEWNVPGVGRCSSVPTAGWTCAGGGAGSCSCTCTKSGEPQIVVGPAVGAECPISVNVP